VAHTARRRRWIVAGAALATLGLLLTTFIVERGGDDRRGGEAHDSPPTAHDIEQIAEPVAVAPAVAVETLTDPDAALLARWHASSQRGTRVDGALSLDASGALVLDVELRRLFDHFLSLTGEFADSDIRRLLQLHIQSAHGEAAAQAALAVFDRYLSMRAALAALPPEDDLATRFTAIRRERERWFGAEADGLFGDEHATVELTLLRRAIQTDPDLDAAQREEQLAALEASRPAAVVEAERIALSAQLAIEQSRQLDAQQADPVARHAERSALWGEEAAGRLAALDDAQAQWDTRLHNYVRQRERLRNDPQLTDAARAAALAALLQARFSGPERVRVEALEAINALPPAGG